MTIHQQRLTLPMPQAVRGYYPHEPTVTIECVTSDALPEVHFTRCYWPDLRPGSEATLWAFRPADAHAHWQGHAQHVQVYLPWLAWSDAPWYHVKRFARQVGTDKHWHAHTKDSWMAQLMAAIPHDTPDFGTLVARCFHT